MMKRPIRTLSLTFFLALALWGAAPALLSAWPDMPGALWAKGGDDDGEDNSGSGSGSGSDDDDSDDDDSDDDSDDSDDDDSDDDDSDDGDDDGDDDNSGSGSGGSSGSSGTPKTPGAAGAAQSAKDGTFGGTGIGVVYLDGSVERISAGRYERRDGRGRLIEQRAATSADRDRLAALKSSDVRRALRGKVAGVVQVGANGASIRISDPSGWTEELDGSRYRLTDPNGNLVTRRTALRRDIARLRALMWLK